jgi:hypothetical protein
MYRDWDCSLADTEKEAKTEETVIDIGSRGGEKRFTDAVADGASTIRWNSVSNRN